MRSAEVKEASRDLTTLALIRLKQGGSLNVRQTENVRRALADAGEALGWAGAAAHSSDPVAMMAKDLRKMLKSGSKILGKEVSDELTAKKTEEARLEAVVVMARELSEDEKAQYPVEIVYVHTALDAARGLITKTEIVTAADAKEAADAATMINRSLGKWGRLRDDMQAELKQTQKNLGVIEEDLGEFVDFWRGLLREVLLTLS